jgi:hypothetical protein
MRRSSRPTAATILLASVILGAPSTATAQTPLDGDARLFVTQELLEVALRRLQRSSGVRLVYSPDLLPQEHRVSCACSSVSVAQALDALLDGTGLTYRSARTQITIAPEQADDRRDTARGVIVGRVVDAEGGRPVVNAMIRLESGQGVLSGANGVFTLRNVPAGAHSLQITSIGWRAETVGAVEVPASDTCRVTVRLSREAIPLAEILVAPGTFGILEELSPGTVRSYTREEIQTMPQLGEDVFRSIKRLPGVAASDISTKLNIRGGTDREVLVRLDGLELQLTTGGFGVESGDKMTGVLDLSSRTETRDAKTTVGMSVTNLTGMSRGSFGDQKGAWLFSARRGFMDWVMKMVGMQDKLNPRYYDLFGKVSYQPAPRHLVSAHVLHAGDNFTYRDQPTDGIDDIDIDTGWDSSYGWLTWKATPGSRVTATTLLSTGKVTRNRDGFVDDPQRPGMPDRISASDHRTFTFAGLRHDLSVRLTNRALLKAGGEVKDVRAEYDYSNASSTRVLVDDALTTVSDSVSVDLDRDGSEVSAWLAARMRPVDRLTRTWLHVC